jgi:hypothetical protein
VVEFVQGGWKKNCSGLRVLAAKGETSRFLGFRDRWTIPKSRFWGSAKYSTGSKANSF